jgi:serine/threonine protein kinase
MTGHTGSIRYMAPEVVLNMPYSEKADVYSFAILIWTIARNKVPFRDLDRAAHRTKVAIQGERPKLQKGLLFTTLKLLQIYMYSNIHTVHTYITLSITLQWATTF